MARMSSLVSPMHVYFDEFEGGVGTVAVSVSEATPDIGIGVMTSEPGAG